MASTRATPLVATSAEETLLLTCTGEVLVCRHVDNGDDIHNRYASASAHNGDDDNDDGGMIPFDFDNIANNPTSASLDISLNSNSLQASINTQQQQQQRRSLQKAWAECCEPERFCDLSTSDNNNNNNAAAHHHHHDRNDRGGGGGLLGGSEDYNHDELVNGMSTNLNNIDITDNRHRDSAVGNDDDWNEVATRRRKKSQQEQSRFQTPLRNNNARDEVNDASSPSSININIGSHDDDGEDDENDDIININDVQLQDHDNFTYIGGNGGGSPTPMLSFDYSGYEPPTPERLLDSNTPPSSTTSSTGGDDRIKISMSGPPPPRLPSTFTSITNSFHEREHSGMNGHHQQSPINQTEQQQQQTQQQQQPRRRSIERNTSPAVLCGIPTFLHHLSQIRITHLSAHPRGHHVLLISEEGLLFSYGSNECGQLGLGRFHKEGDRGRGKGSNYHRVTIPSIVTPLLENGGKTVNCAAGVDYSLLVVRTEGARLSNRRKQQASGGNKLPPSSSRNSHNDRNAHHQMYGFGNNEHMKLGLLDPDGNGGRQRSNNNYNSGGGFTTPRRGRGDDKDIDSPGSASLSCCFSTPDSFATDNSGIVANAETTNYVFLPRRVALHCRVISRQGTNSAGNQAQMDSKPLEYGIFKVAASSQHSAALVRRPNGAVELYSWGKGEALGQPVSQSLEDDIPSPRRWECVPSLKPEKKKNTPTTIATPTLVTTLSSMQGGQSVVKTGAPPRSPRPETRRRSPGTTLPNSENRECLLDPAEYLVNLALGASCTHAVTSSGRWFAFGSSNDGLLGLGSTTNTSPAPTEVKLDGSERIQAISIGEKHAVAVSNQGRAYTWGRFEHGITPDSEDAKSSLSSPKAVKFADMMTSKTSTLENAIMRHIGQDTSNDTSSNHDASSAGVVCAHAGRDLSVFVLESGSVLTCGKKSGRLGQGEVSMDIHSPKPMFGGLQLWRND